MNTPINIDVLCVGHAAYDLIVSVPQHPAEDEKIFASGLLACGGGPAANAAVTVARLGYQAAFGGYLSYDLYGEKHYQELADEGVDMRCVVRGVAPTPLSTIIVKPDGKRALINYKSDTQALSAAAIDFSSITPKTILFDGHEPHLSILLAEQARQLNIPTVLDAGSLHNGTRALMGKVDYLVCSEKFACQLAGDEHTALSQMTKIAPVIVITLGERGLIWRRGIETGALPAYPIIAIDTTGAGDAFHGAFAAAIAAELDWLDILRYASAAGALCCSKMGARLGLPTRADHSALYRSASAVLDGF